MQEIKGLRIDFNFHIYIYILTSVLTSNSSDGIAPGERTSLIVVFVINSTFGEMP